MYCIQIYRNRRDKTTKFFTKPIGFREKLGQQRRFALATAGGDDYTKRAMKTPLPYQLVFENDSLIAVNKAAGINVVADRWDDSAPRLDNLLKSRPAVSQTGSSASSLNRILVVHRLDRDTSGIVIFAKTAPAHKALSLAFEAHQIKKRYIAVVHGIPSWREERCDLPLKADGDRYHRTIIDMATGKASSTKFRLLGSAAHYAVVEAMPESGRTHQIRVHLSALGHPIVCDPLYGNAKPILLSSFKRGWRGNPYEEKPLIERLALHAESISIPSMLLFGYFASAKTDASDQPPQTDKAYTTLKAPAPRDISALIRQLEKASEENFLELTSF